MNFKEYYNYVLQTKAKTEQALRMQMSLEKKLGELIEKLKENKDGNDANSNLKSIRIICQRKLKIIKICEEGLASAVSVFQKIENEVKGSLSLKAKLKAKIPLLIKEDDYEALLAKTLNSFFSVMKLQIDYANTVSSQIKEQVEKQIIIMNELSRKAEDETFNSDVCRQLFNDFLASREKEKEFIDSVRKYSKNNRIFIATQKFLARLEKSSKRRPLMKILYNTMKNHPYLAIYQGFMITMPDVSVGSLSVLYYLGPAYLPVFISLCYVLEWMPSAIALTIEAKKYLNNKKLP